MDAHKKFNPLSIISLISGLTGFLIGVLIFLMYSRIQPTNGMLFFTDGILIPIRNISMLAAIITGIIALWQIKKNGHAEKGKWLAWAGIILGAAWLLFGICTGMVFLISVLSQLL